MLVAAIWLPGCGGSGAPATAKTKIAYIGLTCEAPLFVAYEKGFFKEEGLNPEMVKVDWTTMRESLMSGQVDATHTLVTYLLKPIEQGLDVKMTGGVHKGCLKIQAAANSPIKTVEDLRGKRIGVQTMGSPPFLFANRVLADHGMNPDKDVTWRVYPAAEMELALDKGEIDAVANSEPIGSLLLAHQKVRNVVDQSLDAPYKDEFCCAIAVNGNLIRTDPAKAAKITRAILKATKWVSVNPSAAAKLSVGKWLSVNEELDALALSKLDYEPRVAEAQTSVIATAAALKREGILSASTDAADLGRRAFAQLDGVNDQWVENLSVEKIAGGGRFVPADGRLITFVELPSCCIAKKP
jgi:NitT/TauT family transport system substrate-binding protein